MNARHPSVDTAMPAHAARRSVVAEARDARARVIARGLLAAVRSLRLGLTALRQRRETIAQLRALSDRELADIGVDRGAILAVAANDTVDVRRVA